RTSETDDTLVVERTPLEQGVGDTQGFDVALGEDDLVVALCGKPQSAPDTAGEFGVDTGQLDGLGPGRHSLTAEEDRLDLFRVRTRRHTFSFTARPREGARSTFFHRRLVEFSECPSLSQPRSGRWGRGVPGGLRRAHLSVDLGLEPLRTGHTLQRHALVLRSRLH